MTLGAISLIPLDSAFLCQDCNCISANAMQCPACASGVLMSLAFVLNRESEEDAKENTLRLPALAA